MITTVTTTTTTTVTTIGVTSLALIAIVTMLILLVNKEMFLAANRPWALRFNKALNVAIIPLLVVFITTVVIKVAAVLQ